MNQFSKLNGPQTERPAAASLEGAQLAQADVKSERKSSAPKASTKTSQQLELTYDPAESGLLTAMITDVNHAVRCPAPDDRVTRDPRVVMLQELINASGLLPRNVAVDGIYGDGMRRAIPNVQRELLAKYGMGRVSYDIGQGPDAGPNTFAALTAVAMDKDRLHFTTQELAQRWTTVEPLIRALAHSSPGVERISATFEKDLPGAKTERIKAAQEVLKTLGYYPGQADGIPGPQFQQAIKDFQRSAGLSDEGIAGKETVRAMLQQYLTRD